MISSIYCQCYTKNYLCVNNAKCVLLVKIVNIRKYVNKNGFIRRSVFYIIKCTVKLAYYVVPTFASTLRC